MEKISNKENKEVKMGGKEMERKEDGSDLEQKLKKLERATRACRLTTNKGEEAPKKKRKTWKQEMELLWERFQAKREADEPEMDEKGKFVRALNLVPRKTYPEIVNKLQGGRNFEDGTKDRSEHHAGEEIVEKRTTATEEGSPPKRQRRKDKEESKVEETTKDENHDGEKKSQKCDKEGQKSEKENQKTEEEDQKCEKENEKEDAKKKVKVGERQPCLPDIMAIEEIDLVMFDITR